MDGGHTLRTHDVVVGEEPDPGSFGGFDATVPVTRERPASEVLVVPPVLQIERREVGADMLEVVRPPVVADVDTEALVGLSGQRLERLPKEGRLEGRDDDDEWMHGGGKLPNPFLHVNRTCRGGKG